MLARINAVFILINIERNTPQALPSFAEGAGGVSL